MQPYQDFTSIPKKVLNLSSWVPAKNKKPTGVGGWQKSQKTLQQALDDPEGDSVGFVFRKEYGIVGVDLDHCIVDGKLTPDAESIITKFGSYTEVSMSGNGIHILVEGIKPQPACVFNGVECYDSGKQFILTGDVLSGYENLIENQEALEWLYETYNPVSKKAGTSNKDRARAYMNAMPIAVEKNGGDNQLFKVALAVFRGFDLNEDDAREILYEYNEKCDPPWEEPALTERIEHKIKQARDNSQLPWGYLLKERQEEAEWPTEDPSITLSDCVDQFHQAIRTGSYNRISTGIDQLDMALKGGIRLGEMVIIEGRSSHGKTALGLHIQESLVNAGCNVLLFTLEMSPETIGQRVMQRLVGIEVGEDDVLSSEKVWDLKRQQSLAKVRVISSVEDIDHLINRAKLCRELHGTNVVIVDYLQLVPCKSGGNEYEKITIVSKKLALLRTYGFTVIAMAQMNRDIEKREGFTPKMSDVRGSGQIEQDADIVISAVFDCKAEGADGSRIFPDAEDDDFTIHILKHRQSGPQARKVHCKFDAESQTFNRREVFHEFDDYSPTQQVLGIDEEV